jgi:hypothetical protein
LAEALAVSVDELDAMLAEGQTGDDGRSRSSSQPPANDQVLDGDAAEELPDDCEQDPVLVAPWNRRGTVEAAVMVSGGMQRRTLLSLTGTALTAPAHQWLVHEPEPLLSGLSGRRVSAGLADRLTAMATEIRKMDDIAGGVVCFRWLSTSSAGLPGCSTALCMTSAPAECCASRWPN